ncbi:MAG: hypothetical protein V2A58_17170 [Planctomycetota bacterium]
MDDEELIANLRDLAEAFGYQVRYRELRFPGGACVLEGVKILFVDSSASPEEQIETFARALVDEDLEKVYLLPEVRHAIERFGRPLT